MSKVKENHLLCGSSILFALAICFLLSSNIYIGGYFIVLIANIYLASVLLTAAKRSDEAQKKSWHWDNLLPNKTNGLAIFLLLLFSTSLGFAEIFLHQKVFSKWEDAVYSTFITISSFSYDNYSDKSTCIKFLQMWESFSALLIVSAAFGLLLSRISNYKDKID